MNDLERVRQSAVEEAGAAGSSFVGSEHLFLAWLLLAHGPGHEAAIAAGVTPDALRVLIRGRNRTAPTTEGAGELSSHAQRALAGAQELATAEGRDDPTMDDVLLALIREPRGAIARALTEAKLKPSQLKALVRPRAARRPAEPKPPKPPKAPRAESARPAPASPPPGRERPADRPRRDAETDNIPESRTPQRPRLDPPEKAVRLVPPARRRWSLWWLCFLALPLSVALRYTGAAPWLVFAGSCLAIAPLAALISTATEHLAERTGPMLGAFVNAAFGNATEVIVAVLALRAGYVDLVKASLAGSILGNLLLILGLSLLAGGVREPMLRLNRTAAGMGAAMLALAVAGLILPSLLPATVAPGAVASLSQVVAVILAVTYLGSLWFTLRTHRQLFATGSMRDDATSWGVLKSVLVLAVATVAVGWESQLLVDTIEPVTRTIGLSQLFLGFIVIPIVANAAEHATAVVAARKGKIELAMQVALGSGTQVALMVAPLLVLVSAALGHGMTLVFPGFQVVALAISVIVAAVITLDGESHWFEGVQLLALYAMIAATAYFI